jgi:hypothetical protein
MIAEDIGINVCGRDIYCLWNIQVVTQTSSTGGAMWQIWANSLWADMMYFNLPTNAEEVSLRKSQTVLQIMES